MDAKAKPVPAAIAIFLAPRAYNAWNKAVVPRIIVRENSDKVMAPMYVKFLASLVVALGVTFGAFPVLTAQAQSAPGFISVIDDLPLMSALAEVGEGVEFSTSQGRIAEATARGRVSEKDVLAFYNDTLPQLGWTKVSSGHFAREGETLELVFEAKDDLLNVRFALAPAAPQQ